MKLFGIGALDGAAFTRLVAKLGVESGRFVAPNVDAEAMRIRTANEQMALGNRHHMFLQVPRRQRLRFIQEIVLAAQPDAPKSWADVKATLVPVVRDAGYLAITPLHARTAMGETEGKATTIASRPLATNIFETLVIDTPVQMVLVTEDRLVEWGVSLEEALDAAKDNLRRQSQAPFHRRAPGLWAAPWTDSYAAARVLLPDVLQRVCSDPLVAIPSRDALFVGDARQPGVLAALLEGIELTHENSRYLITPRIYHLDGKTLRDYTPGTDVDAELRAKYERLLVQHAISVYNQERELHEELDDDDIYAALLAYELDTGEVITRATWTKGVEARLPPAQAIVFVELADESPDPLGMWLVPWDVVAAEPGMLTPTDSPLPRWKTGEFPSREWLENHKHSTPAR